MSFCPHNRGFTLLEVLVAFSITALALGVMYQIYAKGTTSALLGKEYAEAVTIAESRLALIGIEEDFSNDYLSGTENDKYDWQITISDYEFTDEENFEFEPPLLLKQVELEISWDSMGKRRSFILHTLRPAPPII